MSSAMPKSTAGAERELIAAAIADSGSVRADGLSEAEVAKQRTLKAVVIGLGILILLAFAGVVAGMAYRASQIGKAPATRTISTVAPALSASPTTGPVAGAPVLQPHVQLTLPPGNSVKAASLHGQRLVVHHDGPAGAGITILDLATGEVVSQVKIDAAQR